MLATHNNLNDIQNRAEALEFLNVQSMGFQNEEDVFIEGGNVQCDFLSLPKLNPGLCYVRGQTANLNTTSDWFNKAQNEISVHLFSNENVDVKSFVRKQNLHPIAFTGDIIDLDISNHYYPLSVYFVSGPGEVRDTRYHEKILDSNFNNIKSPSLARNNLSIADIARFDRLEDYRDPLFVKNLSVPKFDSNGVLVYDAIKGDFGLISNFLSVATYSTTGLVHFSDMDLPSGHQITERFAQLSNALKSKLDVFQPVIDDMIQMIHTSNHHFLSSHNRLEDVDSNLIKTRLGLGSLHTFDSNAMDMRATNTDLVVSSKLKIPKLGIKRFDGIRENTEGTALYQMAADETDHFSNIPYDFFSVATPISSNYTPMPTNDPMMGKTYVYTKHEIDGTPEHIYHQQSNHFGMSYRLFMKDAKDALFYTDNIIRIMSMSDYYRENNLTVVNFETLSNQYGLAGLSPEVNFYAEGMFDVFTENYLTSNMLRSKNNLNEIQQLLNGELNNNLSDFYKGFDRIVQKQPATWTTSSDYLLIDNLLSTLQEQQIQMFAFRDYSDPAKRQAYLENLYDVLELNKIAWSSDFEDLYQKPTSVCQFANDLQYIDSFDSFHQIRNDTEAQIQTCRNIGIGTLARHDANQVNIEDCERFDATFIHARTRFLIDMEIGGFSEDPPVLLVADDHNKGVWTTAPVFNYLNPDIAGLVRFTTDPIAIDNNNVVSLKDLREKQSELLEKFKEVFDAIKSKYLAKSLDVMTFIDSRKRYLFEF